MSRKSYTEGNYRTDPWFRTLCKALAACETEADVAAFLRDVATLSELKALSERLEVAKRIDAGETYRSIMEATGASTTTVTRVARFTLDGAGGYKRFLTKNHHHTTHATRGKRPTPTS
ncbi:MAG: YerC/YecD family TrpR-related protein [Candidatus Peribacteraceae bacterium]|nr:YerC/YecD family TrpR-related protein [Candidatus Peribacteraceae bacterium]